MAALKPESNAERVTYQIRALDRGLDILEAFAPTQPELSIGQIAERAGLPKPTVIRILSVLTERGYVERLPEVERFRLGVKTLELSSVYLQSTTIEAEARPIMARLASETRQTANLGILDQNQVVHIEVVAPDRPVRFWASIGKREDAYVSGLGKVLLGTLDAAALDAYLAEPRPAITQQTITDGDQLRAEIEITARRGFAVDREESNPGVYCIAAPIRNAHGEIVAAVSISGLKVEFEPEDQTIEFSNLVVAAGAEISARLGWIASSEPAGGGER